MIPLVRDAKRLLVNGEGYEPFFFTRKGSELREEYWFCGGYIERTETGSIGHHEEPCPWRNAPRLLEVIKAAEQVAAERTCPTDPDALWLALDALVAALAEPPGGVEAEGC